MYEKAQTFDPFYRRYRSIVRLFPLDVELLSKNNETTFNRAYIVGRISEFNSNKRHIMIAKTP